MNARSIPCLFNKPVGELCPLLGVGTAHPLPPGVEETVRTIVDDVRVQGDRALVHYTRKFDRVRLKASQILVSPAEFEQARRRVPAKTLKTLQRIHDHILSFHRRPGLLARKRHARPGFTIDERLVPMGRVGVYVPGGTAPLVSTVFMTLLPALAAGVEQVYLCTPPGPDGAVNPFILTAALMCGCTSVFKLGGAQAIAALAYGTETVPRVDKICGPGNVFVSAAKKIVYGDVGVDMIAGPSEVVLIADATCNPESAACDLLSQLEHDAHARAVLIFIGPPEPQTIRRIDAVRQALVRRGARLPRRKIVAASMAANLRIVQVADARQAVELADALAPEHLEIITADAEALARSVSNCSAVFVGPWTCVSVGDFWAGPSHVLPTGRNARFSSGLNVYDFLKRQNIIQFTRQGLSRAREAVECLTRIEGLEGHRVSVADRLKSR